MSDVNPNLTWPLFARTGPKQRDAGCAHGVEADLPCIALTDGVRSYQSKRAPTANRASCAQEEVSDEVSAASPTFRSFADDELTVRLHRAPR